MEERREEATTATTKRDLACSMYGALGLLRSIETGLLDTWHCIFAIFDES